MKSSKLLFKVFPILITGLFPLATQAMVANPILSRGKTVYTSSGNAAYLVDNKFKSTAFTASAGSWIALNVGTGHSKVFVNWNNPVDAWGNDLTTGGGCAKSNPFIVDYDLLTSANSTNGSDGTWKVALSVVGNLVTARGNGIDFTGANWVKLSVKKGDGTLDEIEVFDASQGSEDTWFFAGTSITQMTFKENAVSPNFADRITTAHPGFTPVLIRGGIGCIRSGTMLGNIKKYLANAGDAHYWTIEMGTNDGWGGGTSGVSGFTKNMQIIIDSCKGRGIIPIVARPLATNPAKTENGWQLHEDFAKAADSLTAKNHLPTGPDFYNYFLKHPDELKSDGVHPNGTGVASIQRLWAEAVSPVYTAASVMRRPAGLTGPTPHFFSMGPNGHLEIRTSVGGHTEAFEANGSKPLP